jgi:hypothetical protein
MNWGGRGRRRSWPNLWIALLQHLPKRPEKTAKKKPSSQDEQHSGRDTNTAPLE